MSIVSNSIINADAEARYLSPGELDQIKAFVTGGQRRLRVAQVLCESRERIVKQAGGQLFQKRPDVISPGGNAYGEDDRHLPARHGLLPASGDLRHRRG